MTTEKLIDLAEEATLCVQHKMRRAVYMGKLEGEFKGVKWRSLNPTSEQIRAKDVERLCLRTGKTTGELFPNPGELHAFLSKPELRERYYARARQRVR